MGLQLLAPFGADAVLLRAAAALEAQLALPKGCAVPRQGTFELNTEGPRTPGRGRKGFIFLFLLLNLFKCKRRKGHFERSEFGQDS